MPFLLIESPQLLQNSLKKIQDVYLPVLIFQSYQNITVLCLAKPH